MKLKDSLRKKIIASVMTGVMAVVVAAPYSMVSAADMTHGRLPVKAVQKDGPKHDNDVRKPGDRKDVRKDVKKDRKADKKDIKKELKKDAKKPGVMKKQPPKRGDVRNGKDMARHDQKGHGDKKDTPRRGRA
jgi:hypothetical protein